MIKIPLRDKHGKIKAYTVIDFSDRKQAKHRWHLSEGYAVRNVCYRDEDNKKKYKSILLHREILGLVQYDGVQCDHFDGDHLNNRKNNLRVSTNAENAQNRSSQGTTSNCRGVYWNSLKQKWQAQVWLNGKNNYIGRFDTEEEAAKAASSFRVSNMPFTNEDRSVAA